jgi:hypothetical protein
MTPQEEEPKLAFREYAIAFHVAASWRAEDTPPSAKGRAQRALESYEDDMLLYAHRDRPPFRTRVVPAPFEQVTVGFRRDLTYEAEGQRKRMRCAGAGEDGRFRSFGVAFGETIFQRSEVVAEKKHSPLGVLTLVLTPGEELNEYDVIKLAKLWEGGESVGTLSAIREGKDLWFATRTGERRTFHALARQAFPGWQLLDYAEAGHRTAARRGYRVGTIELQLPRTRWRSQVFADVARLKKLREAPKAVARWDRAVAVGGLVQGLLDFRAIEDYELADVFAEIDINPGDETLRGFHKGTLLSLSSEEEDEEDERPSPLGVDPYLAIPNIVLLHNEQRLKSARRLEGALSARQRGPARELFERAAINETENGLSDMARLLAQDLPNVFHYASERQLEERGRQSRGLDDLKTFVRLRIDDLSSVLESRVRNRDRWTAVLGIAVGVVTAFLVQQAIQGRPLWLIVIAAVALFGIFLWLRDRLF